MKLLPKTFSVDSLALATITLGAVTVFAEFIRGHQADAKFAIGLSFAVCCMWTLLKIHRSLMANGDGGI